MGGSPYHLAVDGGGDQFPVTGPAPRLSWKTPADTTAPYELEATIDGALQPAVTTDQRLYVPWPWQALRSGQRIQWRVRAADSDDWSEWSAFEAGLWDADWTASWITPVEEEDPGYGRRPAYLLSTHFELPAAVTSARLYATALGVYTAAINGERAGTAELSPGSTSYDQTLYAQAFDVTSSLVPGQNRVDLELSDGWYRGQVGAFRLPAGWGTTLGARAELHIELSDGTRQVIRTDGTWTSTPSTTTRADLMDGQSVDFGKPAEPTVKVLVDQVEAPPIDWSPAPPVRVIDSRAPEQIYKVRPGVWVADFGQNASGWIRLEDLGPEGTRTVIEYGEHLGPDGDLSTSHLDSHRPGEPARIFSQRDEVTAGPAAAVFEPRHTVHGFQYARISRDGTALDPSALTMQVVHTDLRRTGEFSCSNEDLNRLHSIGEWSFLGNAVDVPTDCPTRERVAWTGDYQVFISTATRLRDVLGFSRKWLRSVRDDQLDDGRIANFSPDGRRIKNNLDDQFAMMTGSAGWGDAIVAVPWALYEEYGDEAVLAENWNAMDRWVQWALDKARTTRHHARARQSPEPEPFEQYLWDGTFHWGEWTEPKKRDADGKLIDPVQDNPMAWFMEDKGEVGTAYLYRSAATLSRAAHVLGRIAEAAKYADIAESIRLAWQAAYLHPDGTTVADTQASYVRALSFGLLPEDVRGPAADRLVELIRDADTHLGTGFLSTGDLLPVLVEAGREDVAYELLLQRSAPSWLYMVDKAATTIWESWEGIDHEGNAHDSLNHYSKGTVLRFLHEYTLGLRQDSGSVAWRSVVIAPTPGPDLTWARGSHETPNGTIKVHWQLDGDELRIDAVIPAETTARIVFPDGTEYTAGPGRYRAARSIPSANTHLTYAT
ncbi:family 78 glycoside hydrolase catalytic domain [Pseudarthrobacter sp. BRE9]|uniref:family 78 glycoside hydrolase catalytic domain n=1 Tax=Pseudarthrobacter sp. BRE9 TaxID=2962582 RepID=UPI00288140EE|nr:family 78 glycoside hydrolase catalytic domain [Pseudarthrobacter sp. BRE9]MDT0169016.1 family 78 glycoside hydrolase catalytic domain [Pseudarthrobacter sp. BRE9]